MKTSKISCRMCNSKKTKKNGHNSAGSPTYHCNNCNYYGVITPKIKYTNERKQEIIRAYQERSSMRGIERTFGVARQTLASWLKKNVAGSTVT